MFTVENVFLNELEKINTRPLTADFLADVVDNAEQLEGWERYFFSVLAIAKAIQCPFERSYSLKQFAVKLTSIGLFAEANTVIKAIPVSKVASEAISEISSIQDELQRFRSLGNQSLTMKPKPLEL